MRFRMDAAFLVPYRLLLRLHDVHFFRLGNELVAELGMGDGDDGLSLCQVDRPFKFTMPYSVTR